ncbi:hypothetical protein Q7P37_002822 [Cladosporium fusiforme]
MYAITLTAVALLSSLAAAHIPGLPNCAANCVGDSFGSCGALDVKCICSNTELLTGLSCCVSKACNKEDQDKTLQFAGSLCGGEGGGTNNLPTAATCADSASSTGAAQSGSSSSADAGSTTGSATSSASDSQSSSTASDETTVLSGSATDSSTESAPSETDASSTSSRPAESTGGADGLAVRLGSAGLGVVVAGVMAAL